mmetsp:Transcript_19655/g.39304  ORF Transcript_19655/g.39304 Transcript_19655/m.39304 type:complete len:253 (+) Transcript_19655:965-1723(+)
MALPWLVPWLPEPDSWVVVSSSSFSSASPFLPFLRGRLTSSTRLFWRISCSSPLSLSSSPSSLFMLLETCSLSCCASAKTFWASFTACSLTFSSLLAASSWSSDWASSALALATLAASSSSLETTAASLALLSLSLASTFSTGVTKSRPSSYASWASSFALCCLSSDFFSTYSSLALPTATSYARRSLSPVFSRKGWRTTSSASLTAALAASTSLLASETTFSAASSSLWTLSAWSEEAFSRDRCSLSFVSV